MSRARLVAVILLSIVGTRAIAQEPDPGGSIRGRILFEGDLPKLEPLVEPGGRRKGRPGRGERPFEHGVPDESLVVNSKTRGVANVFVYLRHRPEGIPAKFRQPPKELVDVKLTEGRFQPRAVFTRAGQKIRYSSKDGRIYNPHPFPLKNEQLGYLLPPDGVSKGLSFAYDKPEILPIQVKCDIHPWMVGYWLILDHPYAAITDAKGRFEIQGLPPGKHSFRVWHERAGYLERALEVEVRAGGATEIPTRSYPAEKFE